MTIFDDVTVRWLVGLFYSNRIVSKSVGNVEIDTNNDLELDCIRLL